MWKSEREGDGGGEGVAGLDVHITEERSQFDSPMNHTPPTHTHLLIQHTLLHAQCGEAVNEAEADHTRPYRLSRLVPLIQRGVVAAIRDIGDVHKT